MTPQRGFATVWRVMLCTCFIWAFAATATADEANIGLGYTERSMAFREYESSRNLQGEIRYLIKLVKYSKMRIVKAGREFTSNQAARYLMMKLKTARQEIRSTEQFIDEFASYSQDGHLIYIIDRKGMNYPARNVLYSELRRLRDLRASDFR